jgi:hypothetical protein
MNPRSFGHRAIVPLVGLALVGAVMTTPLIEVQASTGVRAASYSFSPNPIAATGTLPAGQSVNITLTARTSTGAPAPNGWVKIELIQARPNGRIVANGFGIGTLNVHSTCLRPSGNGQSCGYKTNAQGQITMTYTAAAPPPPQGNSDAWSDLVRAWSSSVALTADTYTY